MEMNIQLNRQSQRADGIFGSLYVSDAPFCVTLEHAFADSYGGYWPAVPKGNYTCVLGSHQLAHYNQGRAFQSYEVQSVPGHRGIIFHPGNHNADSKGCIFLGLGVHTHSSTWSVTHSQEAFERFLALLSGSSAFYLSVT
ncbi:DUF5675 family protein [Variovorax gossypii]